MGHSTGRAGLPQFYVYKYCVDLILVCFQSKIDVSRGNQNSRCADVERRLSEKFENGISYGLRDVKL